MWAWAATAALALWLTQALCLATDWPMFRGGPALTGVAEGRLPEKLALRWSFKTGGPVKSSAALVQNRVFIGSDDGKVYALDLDGGKEDWSFKTGGAVESSPLVLQNRVFVGSDDGFLYALDAATGKVAWKYETEDKIPGAPNWAEGGRARGEGRGARGGAIEPSRPRSSSPTPRPAPLVLVGSYDFKLHCLDAVTGKSNWVVETGNYINGAPAVSAGQAVFGGCDGQLHVIELAQGRQVQAIDAGAYIPGSAALADGRAYFGQYENQFLCVDLTAGKPAWVFKDRSFPYFSSPAVTPDRVLFGGRDKLLHCVRRADGTALWSFAARGKIDSSPVVCGDKVVVGSDDGRLYVVSLEQGKELWSYEVGEPIESSPAVANGKIVIGSNDGRVYCFGAAEDESAKRSN